MAVMLELKQWLLDLLGRRRYIEDRSKEGGDEWSRGYAEGYRVAIETVLRRVIEIIRRDMV
jgi:hypothetical protein